MGVLGPTSVLSNDGKFKADSVGVGVPKRRTVSKRESHQDTSNSNRYKSKSQSAFSLLLVRRSYP